MNECLRCGQECGDAIFCNQCQLSLLERSQQNELKPVAIHKGSPRAPILVTELSSSHSFPVQSVKPKLIFDDVTIDDEPAHHPHFIKFIRFTPSVRSGITLLSPKPSPAPPAVLHQTTNLLVDSTPILKSHSNKGLTKITRTPRLSLTRVRKVFLIMALLALLALIVDSILVTLIFSRHQSVSQDINRLPVLTFTPNIVYPGQVAKLRISHFSPSSRVLLRRDIAQQVRVDNANSLIQVDSSGNAEVLILIEDNWGAGSHFIEAEDIEAHSIASAAINVIGSTPQQEPHFQVNQSEIDFGADQEGANTLQSVTLRNTGNGTITWIGWSNQPWLSLTPTQGTFSQSQRITLAASRYQLAPGNYEGQVTLTANTGTSISLHVKLSVLALPFDMGAVLVVSPPALSFTTTDGGNDPDEQLITISNPGKSPLYWKFNSSAATVSLDEQIPFQENMQWLSIEPSTGVLQPGKVTSVHLHAHAQKLLSSVYSGILSFTAAQNALNTPQPVAISLTVAPRCGISSNTGMLSFTTIMGENHLTTQTLTLHLSKACQDTLHWRASSLAPWLTITPASGEIQKQASSFTSLTVNSSGLATGNYNSFVILQTEHRTQTITIQLSVLAPSDKKVSANTATAGPNTPPSSPSQTTGSDGGANNENAPLLALSPTDLTFSVIRGDNNPPGQNVTLLNNGGSTLYWQAREDNSGMSWLTVTPTQGTLSGEQTTQLQFNINSSTLPAGTYRTNVVIIATDGPGAQIQGSPQMITITLNVIQPCTLQVSPTDLAFTASLLSTRPSSQKLTVNSSGTCSYPITWKAVTDPASQRWLSLSNTSGSDTGNGTILSVQVNTQNMLLGFYRGQITFSAVDSNGTLLHNNSFTVSVTLTVLG